MIQSLQLSSVVVGSTCTYMVSVVLLGVNYSSCQFPTLHVLSMLECVRVYAYVVKF